MGLRGRLTDFIESLIPPEERSINPMLHRTSFLRIALLTVLCLIGSAASFLYAYMDYHEGDVYVAFLETIVGFVLGANPLIAKKYRNIDTLATISIFLFGAIFIVAIFDELPHDKSSLIWIGVVPALIFIMKGRRGIYWSLGYLVIHFSFVLVRGGLDLNILMDAYLSYLIVSVIFYFYAWMSERYREVWENIARTDSLTGALNRIAFEDILNREIRNAKRKGRPLSLIIFDVDNFKSINDSFGHLFGDKVLRKVANLVAENLRETDVFARWGGEEFIILLPDTDLDRAVAVADKLRRIIHSYRFMNNLTVTASFGVTQFEEEDDVVRFVMKADKALYTAKRNGKNRVESFLSQVP